MELALLFAVVVAFSIFIGWLIGKVERLEARVAELKKELMLHKHG